MTIVRTIPPRKPRAESTDAGEIQRQIDLAKDLIQRNRRSAAVDHLAKLRQRCPRAAMVWLESAFMLDGLGREAEAIPLYEQALRLGLHGKPLRDAMVCCASSLRNMGRLQEAVQMLKRATRRFPGDVVVKFFLALGFHDAGEETQAVRVLALAWLRELNDDDLAGFRRTLQSKFRSLLSVRPKEKKKSSEPPIAPVVARNVSRDPIAPDDFTVAAASH